MLLVSWNVNSLTARLPRVLEFLDRHRPDAVLLQETKVAPAAFPAGPLAEAGYSAIHWSGGRWAGVAILAPARTPLTDPVSGLPGEARPDEARWVEASLGDLRLVSVYVPNGRSLDSPAYDDKLRFLDAMLARVRSLNGGPLVVAGDLNIARDDRDVWDPALFVGTTHTSEPERRALDAILESDMADAFRQVEPAGTGFTYWDYRAGMFHKNMGMRIDYHLVSRALAPRVRRCGIDREFRKGVKPSDHAPLLLELAETP